MVNDPVLEMKIVIAYPPMIEEIDKAFKVKGKPVIYCWGETIYNPMGVHIDNKLKAHEGVHFARQSNETAKIEAWWSKYISDPEFRLNEEIPAHRAEYKEFCNHNKDRNARSHFLRHVATKLASPIYGSVITSTAARIRIAN